MNLNLPSSSNDKECNCEACKNGPEEAQRRDNESLRKYGWYSHVVEDETEFSPTGFSYHTHGFPDKFGVPDVQVVLKLDARAVHEIVGGLVKNWLSRGFAIRDGMVLDASFICLQDTVIKFVSAKENDRTVLRIILPDPLGSVTEDEMQFPYSQQHTVKNGEGNLEYGLV